jgi:hypothetical protein
MINVKTRIMLICLALLMFAGAVMTAYAPPPTYDITSNWHGIDTPIGSTVIATAATTDNTVYNITFLWHQPITNLTVFTDVVPASFNGSMYIATSTHIILDVGDWGVQALFQSPTGTTKENVNNVTATRATSFNVITPPNQVPEVPLGPVIATTSMIAAFGVFYAFKRRALSVTS